MAVNSPGGYSRPHTPKSPRHFVFPQKSPSISSASSGYYTPQSGPAHEPAAQHANAPPKSPKHNMPPRSPKSPRHFNFAPPKSPTGRSSPTPYGQQSPTSSIASQSSVNRSKHSSRPPVPVHIHMNPGYVSPNRNRQNRFSSTSSVSSPRVLNSPSIVSDSDFTSPTTPITATEDTGSSYDFKLCRKSTSDLTEMTDDTPLSRTTSISRPSSPMRRGSVKGLAYLASRRGSRESMTSNCSNESIGPLNFQNTPRGRQRRTSNFLELPVVEHARPRVCSLPERGFNPRLSDELYRLRSFATTNKGGVVNCGDSIINRRSRSNTSVNSNTSRSDRSPFDGSCCSGYRPVESDTLSTPDEQDLEPRLLSRAAAMWRGEDREDPEVLRKRNSLLQMELSPHLITKYRVVLLGDAGVGKTALVSQFMTSEYMNTYDASLDDEFGEKTVSVLLDGEESELVFIDHPSNEMSVENCIATYSPHACLVVYSVVDRNTFGRAAEVVGYLAREGFARDHAVIVVGNKADLARARQIPATEGKALACNRDCKFIETSSGIQHNVDELLVGILKQIRLKENREKKINKKEAKVPKLTSSRTHISLNIAREILQKIGINDICKSKSCENLHVL